MSRSEFGYRVRKYVVAVAWSAVALSGLVVVAASVAAWAALAGRFPLN